jgi:hypothetical protein
MMYEFSYSAVNSLDCMNSHNNNMNSSDYMNSYVPPCVFVPDKELDVWSNGHDKSNTLDDTSDMCIDTDSIDTDHVIQMCTTPIHMI